MGEFTVLLGALKSEENQQAVGALFTAAYDELRALARQRLSRGAPITTLETTGLVHEAFLRFERAGKLEITDRNKFMAYASRVMRNIVIDTVREKQSERRGGEINFVTLNTAVGNTVEDEAGVLQLDEALTVLEAADPELVQIVEMRYFSGMSVEAVAQALGKSPRTIFREWEKARLILLTQLGGAR